MLLKNRSKARGFTLIELMVTVAIIGLLVAIAYPSYLQHIQRSWRESARLCLLDMTQQMERRYATELAYNIIDADADGNDDQLMLSSCANDGEIAARYQFGAIPAVNGFNLTARPIGGQAADDCGTLGLNQSGVKSIVGGTAPLAECW